MIPVRRFTKKFSLRRKWTGQTARLRLVKPGHSSSNNPAHKKPSLRFYFQILMSSPHPISICTKDKYYVAVNDAWLEVTGYQRNAVLGRRVDEISLGDIMEAQKQELFKEQNNNFTFTHVTRNLVEVWITVGESRAIQWVSFNQTDDNDDYIVSTGVDVTKDIQDLKQANQALSLSEEKFFKAFNASPTPMSISILEDGCFVDVNEAFCRVVGFEREEMLGRTSFDLHLWTDPVDRLQVKQKILRGEPVRDLEVCFQKKSGEERQGLYSAESTNIDGQHCLLSILTDITDHKKAAEEIRFLSFHDRLTGLYNRAYFEEELKRLDTERQLPLSIIMGDVNGLKLINDALGHQEGDKLLVTVAMALRQACRSEDIVARWGGDEFIILLPCCPSTVATRVVERIKTAETIFHTLPIQTSISLGTATKSRSSEDTRNILKEAEDKMYRNKLLENKSTRSYFLSSLERTLWSRSHETKEHCERIKKMAIQIGEHVRLPASEMDSLRLLAALHDIGKIAISNSILEKPGKLTDEEWDTIKKHPEVGYRIALSSPEMAPIAEAILHHHERWDGLGYPLGLRGKDIPFLSRIISIVDAYDVMTNGRPYQAAVSSEEAWDEIIRLAGSQFDPDLVKTISSLRFSKSDWE